MTLRPAAVFDDQTGCGDLRCDLRARFKRVGISVGIRFDRRRPHILVADLRDHVGIFVLYADGIDPVRGGGNPSTKASMKRTGLSELT